MDLNSLTTKRIRKNKARKERLGTCLYFWGTIDDHKHICRLYKGHLAKAHRCNCGSSTNKEKV